MIHSHIPASTKTEIETLHEQKIWKDNESILDSQTMSHPTRAGSSLQCSSGMPTVAAAGNNGFSGSRHGNSNSNGAVLMMAAVDLTLASTYIPAIMCLIRTTLLVVIMSR